MSGFRYWYSAPAAQAMTGTSIDRIAEAIGVSPERLIDRFDGVDWLSVDRLTPAELRRFRAYFWRLGVGLVDTPLIEAVFRVPILEAARSWRVAAERFPDSTHAGPVVTVFAKAWRRWLRLRGLGDRIRRTAAK